MRRNSIIAVVLLVVGAIAAILSVQGVSWAYHNSQPVGTTHRLVTAGSLPASAYVYYTLKQTTGFVLARAPKGSDGQPTGSLGSLQVISGFSDSFGLAESDSVLSMQLSPDGRYLAINGARDHGEQVWMFDTQQMKMSLTPAFVLGNFLHWMPKGNGHTFLYRPMFPMGPNAPIDGGIWNPGLWEVNAATSAHININIQVPSAYLVDATPSPDGLHIVYSTSAGLGLGSDVWLVNSDGSHLSHLFRASGGAQSIVGLFAWSPDGTTIAYERLADSPVPFLPAGLWTMNSTGGQQQLLANIDGGHGFLPVWSPDSHKLAYVVRTNLGDHLADEQVQSLQCAIAAINVTTRQSWNVASPNQTGMQLNMHPMWSADSANITFTASNPFNMVIGGMPRYWIARAVGSQSQPSLSTLTPAILNVVAIG